jgi:hypothetical protein
MYDHSRSRADSAHIAGGGATIIPFPRRRPLRHIEREEDRRRMRQNLAAAIVVALLVTLGFWIIDGLTTSGHIAVCIEAGHPHCQPQLWHYQ